MLKPRYPLHIMKRAAILLAFIAFSCASGSSQAPSKEPVIDLHQIVGPSNVQSVGPFDVKYELRVANPSTEPITLRRFEIRSINGGSYVLVNNVPFTFNETIQPGSSSSVSLWAHAYAQVRPNDFGSSEPVTLRGVASFQSGTRKFQKVFHKTLSQFGE
jgi:hypothetical protein